MDSAPFVWHSLDVATDRDCPPGRFFDRIVGPGDLQAAGAWVDSDWTALERLLDGRLDAIIACAGGPWDHAPAVVLTEEAGGRFRDPDGGRRLDLSGAVYTNGLIDEQLDALIQRQNRAGHTPA